MRLTQRLHDLGLIDAGRRGCAGPHPRPQLRPARGVADRACWPRDRPDDDGRRRAARVMDEITPLIESLQNYVWRRHTLSVRPPVCSSRRRPGRRGRARQTGVGFADIVGYTRQTRSLSRRSSAGWSTTSRHARWRSSPRTTGGSSRPSATRSCSPPTAGGRSRAIGLELVEEHVRRRGLPAAAGRRRVGDGAGPARRRVRPRGQHRLPAHLGRAPGPRARGQGPGRRPPGRRELQAAPDAAHRR